MASGDLGGRERVSSVIGGVSIPVKTSDGGRERRIEGAGDRFAKGSSSRRYDDGEMRPGIAPSADDIGSMIGSGGSKSPS